VIEIYDFERVFISTLTKYYKKGLGMAEKTIYTKDWLIKELAQRASFTIGDTRIIFKAFEDIIKDIIFDGDELVIPGLFALSVTTIDKHDGWNAIKNEKMEVPESHRIKFKASRTLLELFEQKK